MPQAAMSISAPPCGTPTGKNSDSSGPALSRRGLIALGGATALAVALPAAVGVGTPRGGEAAFWTAHARWQALNDAWEADPDDGDANWARQSALVEAARDTMMLIPVVSAAALIAKWDAVEGQDVNLPGAIGNTTLMFRADLARIAQQEQRA